MWIVGPVLLSGTDSHPHVSSVYLPLLENHCLYAILLSQAHRSSSNPPTQAHLLTMPCLPTSLSIPVPCQPLLWGAESPFFLKFFLNFWVYLFIYFGPCWVFVSVRGLSLVAASGGHSSSRCAGLSLSRPLLLRSTGSRRAGSVNCGSRAQLLRGMWDPPRPGLEPVSPALAGRFSTTAPPGKPLSLHFNVQQRHPFPG